MKIIAIALVAASILFSCSAIYAQKQSSGERAFQTYVTNLSSVDKVEILATKWLGTNLKTIDCTNPSVVCSRYPGRILASKILADQDVTKISGLWRKLKMGNGAACFAPGYVLRFYNKNKLVLIADVCFHCCNLTLPNTGILSMCGDETAEKDFKDFVTTELPFPETK